MTNIKLGDKVVRDGATVNEGTVRLGEGAPYSVRFAQATKWSAIRRARTRATCG